MSDSPILIGHIFAGTLGLLSGTAANVKRMVCFFSQQTTPILPVPLS
jgi:hypothetical protein